MSTAIFLLTALALALAGLGTSTGPGGKGEFWAGIVLIVVALWFVCASGIFG